MECLYNLKWFLCEDGTPCSSYRIWKIVLWLLVSMIISASVVVSLPFIASLDLFNIIGDHCDLNKIPIMIFRCYLVGLFYLLMLLLAMAIAGLIITILCFYIWKIANTGLKAHCTYNLLECCCDIINLKLYVWQFYVILIIFAFTYLFLFPYTLSIPIYGKLTVMSYISTIVITFGSSVICIIIIILIGLLCFNCHTCLKQRRKDSLIESDIPIYDSIDQPA